MHVLSPRRVATGLVRRGFTLIELLVVVAIIALLISILLPSLQRAREQAKLVKCSSNLRQVLMSAMNYASDHRDFPPAITQNKCIDARGRFWAKPSWLNYNAHNPACASAGGAVWPYLGSYLPAPDVFICPMSPGKPLAMNEDYEDADTRFLHGSYYLLWNYPALEMSGFYGPRNPDDQRGPDGGIGLSSSDRLLVADRLEFNDPEGSFTWDASHRFEGARRELGETISIWTSEGVYTSTDPNDRRPMIRNNAGYLDGHVSAWNSEAAVPMERRVTEAIIMLPERAAPYRPGGVLNP